MSPITSPMMVASPPPRMPTMIEVRAPYMSWEKISSPAWVVPSQ
jgi:hypothetical protein